MISASHRKLDSREALVRWLRDRSSGGRTSHSGTFGCRFPILDCMPFPRFSIESRQSKSPKNIDREYSSVFQRRWGAIRSMETAGRPNSANSFICLIEIQAKNVFFRVFASAIGEIFVFSDDFKTAFLQHSYRPDVVRCYLAKIGRSYKRRSILLSASVANPLPQNSRPSQ